MPDSLDIGLTDSGHFRLDPILLTKHCVVFGSTGAGKTVLYKSIVEEASTRGVPVLAIDPKGDISSLAVRSENFDFRPYSDPEAEAKGIEANEYAKQLEQTYRQQLDRFGVSSDKVHRFISDVEIRIYTPRSVAGILISISPNLEPPPNFQGMPENDPTLAYELLELTSSMILKLIGYSDEDRCTCPSFQRF